MDIQVFVNGHLVTPYQGGAMLALSFIMTWSLKFSRDDAWCNAHPILAIPCKLLRGVMPDYGMALQDVSKLLSGKKLGKSDE